MRQSTIWRVESLQSLVIVLDFGTMTAYDLAQMHGRLLSLSAIVLCRGILIVGTLRSACAQTLEKPIDPNDAGLTFTFPIHPGNRPLRFRLELNKQGFVSGISVFGPDHSKLLQSVASCGVGDETYAEFEKQTSDPLLKHADLNFDGFEDLELLYEYVPHLGKNLYCIYLWDPKVGRFRYSSELTKIGTNLEAHPEDKTLTTHEDWMFGPWQDSTYRWHAGKVELIEQRSLLGSWSVPVGGRKGCGFSYTCSRLISGKMVDTLKKPICQPEEMDDLPDCPATPPKRSQSPVFIDPFRVDNP
jgi:hypothetical protein